MRAVLLDTNAYTAFMLGAAEVVEVVAHAEKLFLNSIVLGELLGGFAAGTREPKNRGELARFLESPRVEVLPSPLTPPTATRWSTWACAARGSPFQATISGSRPVRWSTVPPC